MTPAQTCARYVALFEHLSPDTIAQLEPLLSASVRFQDPFNDVHGVAGVTQVLEDMFRRATEPRFSVQHWAVDDNSGYILWTFSAGLPGLGPWQVEGVSRLLFDMDGRIASHVDYWDAGALYERLPLLGRLLRLIKKRISAKASAAGC